MQIGIDSFAGGRDLGDSERDDVKIMEQLLEQIELADKVGLDVFGIGEHHRKEFLDSATHMILSAASQRTRNIILTSAVTVLSAADPVRVFQNYATLDLLSNGRAEIVAGRGSFTEAFDVFGMDRSKYNELYEEKLQLLLQLNQQETVTWSGQFRPPLVNQPIYPRPTKPLKIWRGVGGTPGSFQLAGIYGIPLMVAIIGGETHRFRRFIDIYKQAYLDRGHDPAGMQVGIHSFGYVAETSQKAIDDFYPGYKSMFDRIGRERGWPPVTMDRFLFQNSPTGAYLIGDSEEVAQKIVRHSRALGGLDRFQFQIENEKLSQEKVLASIELMGTEVKPRVLELLEENPVEKLV
ncbi:MAG: LLM class flavin-dependent oxidoreductase [Candidatus Kariarchaeaceae archaeon]